MAGRAQLGDAEESVHVGVAQARETGTPAARARDAARPRRRGDAMSRILRWASNGLAALLLLLCATAILCWARSHWRSDHLARFSSWRYWEAVSADGMLSLRRTTYPQPVARRADELRLRHVSGPPGQLAAARGRSWPDGLGFDRRTLRHPGGGYRLDILVVPWWSVAVPAALPPLAWFFRRSRRPTAVGHCPAC